jgi:hypothetical protein
MAPKKKAAKKKKKATKRKTTRSRAKKDVLERRKLVWAIYGSTMKEEARFPYEDLKAAEEKLELLRSKSKKSYFIQPLKEPITKEDEEDADAEAAAEGDSEEGGTATKKKAATKKAATKKAAKKK